MRVQEFNARRDELRKNLKAQGMTQSAAREESWRLARKEFAPEGTVEDGNAIGSALDLPVFEYRSQRAYAAAAYPENQLGPPPSASALTMLQYAKQHLGAFIELEEFRRKAREQEAEHRGFEDQINALERQLNAHNATKRSMTP